MNLIVKKTTEIIELKKKKIKVKNIVIVACYFCIKKKNGDFVNLLLAKRKENVFANMPL
jgi:hypothetical protein